MSRIALLRAVMFNYPRQQLVRFTYQRGGPIVYLDLFFSEANADYILKNITITGKFA